MRGDGHNHEQRRTQGRAGGGHFGCSELTGPLVALIPANELDRAKGRLASLLDESERVQLFLATLQTAAGSAVGAGFETVVLTRDPRIRGYLPEGATVMDEDAGLSGLNAQLESAVGRLNARRLLILHADLPLVTAEALAEMVRSTAGEDGPVAALAESRDGGTNAMVLAPPGLFPLAYGRGSFERHLELAREAGVVTSVYAHPFLALDLDTVDDCWELLQRPVGPGSPAGRFLRSIGFENRLATDL